MCGMFDVHLSSAASAAYWGYGSVLSFKPVYNLLIMLDEVVVPRHMVPFVVYSVLMYHLSGLLRFGILALHCHSNQCVAHYACHGGNSAVGVFCGALYVRLSNSASYTSWNYGSVLSFKIKICSRRVLSNPSTTPRQKKRSDTYGRQVYH